MISRSCLLIIRQNKTLQLSKNTTAHRSISNDMPLGALEFLLSFQRSKEKKEKNTWVKGSILVQNFTRMALSLNMQSSVKISFSKVKVQTAHKWTIDLKLSAQRLSRSRDHVIVWIRSSLSTAIIWRARLRNLLRRFLFSPQSAKACYFLCFTLRFPRTAFLCLSGLSGLKNMYKDRSPWPQRKW